MGMFLTMAGWDKEALGSTDLGFLSLLLASSSKKAGRVERRNLEVSYSDLCEWKKNRQLRLKGGL